MKDNKDLHFYKELLINKFGNELGCEIYNLALDYLLKLIDLNKNDNKYERPHTYKKIYPACSIFYALINKGIKRDEASKFVDKALCVHSIPLAKSYQSMLKFPGLYKLMPKIFKKVTLKSFGEKAGFKFKFYNTSKSEVKFDMTECLYYKTCTRLGCPEICSGFCHTDDVCNENMHKYLVWNRHQTIGEGGKLCDFNLYIDKNKNKN